MALSGWYGRNLHDDISMVMLFASIGFWIDQPRFRLFFFKGLEYPWRGVMSLGRPRHLHMSYDRPSIGDNFMVLPTKHRMQLEEVFVTRDPSFSAAQDHTAGRMSMHRRTVHFYPDTWSFRLLSLSKSSVTTTAFGYPARSKTQCQRILNMQRGRRLPLPHTSGQPKALESGIALSSHRSCQIATVDVKPTTQEPFLPCTTTTLQNDCAFLILP